MWVYDKKIQFTCGCPSLVLTTFSFVVGQKLLKIKMCNNNHTTTMFSEKKSWSESPACRTCGALKWPWDKKTFVVGQKKKLAWWDITWSQNNFFEYQGRKTMPSRTMCCLKKCSCLKRTTNCFMAKLGCWDKNYRLVHPKQDTTDQKIIGRRTKIILSWNSRIVTQSWKIRLSDQCTGVTNMSFYENRTFLYWDNGKWSWGQDSVLECVNLLRCQNN